jgi:hypothetical protein
LSREGVFDVTKAFTVFVELLQSVNEGVEDFLFAVDIEGSVVSEV